MSRHTNRPTPRAHALRLDPPAILQVTLAAMLASSIAWLLTRL